MMVKSGHYTRGYAAAITGASARIGPILPPSIPMVLYGGSVKPNNAEEIFSLQDVDGGLIGGASLNFSDFNAIVQAANG